MEPREEEYQEYLDDIFDLTTLGWKGLPLSILLKRADPIAYWVGFSEYIGENPNPATDD